AQQLTRRARVDAGACHDLQARARTELEEARLEALARILVAGTDACIEESRIERGHRVDVAHPQRDVFDARVHRRHNSTSSVCGSLPTTNTWRPTLANPCLR